LYYALFITGDSGGPILQWIGDRWEQVGITSYALYGCARRGYPPVFTRLASYYDWIESIINPNNYTTSTSTTTTEITRQTESPVTMYSTTEQPSTRYKCNRTVSCGCGRLDVSFVLSNIIGSVDTGIYRWTMIVSIRLNNTNQHSCTGTILTDRYILTTAHCVQNQSLWKITVVSQHYRLSTEPSETYQVDRIHQHPNYRNRGNHFENDIALLHLTESIHVGFVALVTQTCIPKVNSPIDISQYPSNRTRLAIIGWGMTRNNESYTSDKLQQAEIFVIDNKNPTCSNSNIDPNKQFCAGFEHDGAGMYFLDIS
jgi:secreted trypsin-like serine protease